MVCRSRLTALNGDAGIVGAGQGPRAEGVVDDGEVQPVLVDRQELLEHDGQARADVGRVRELVEALVDARGDPPPRVSSPAIRSSCLLGK